MKVKRLFPTGPTCRRNTRLHQFFKAVKDNNVPLVKGKFKAMHRLANDAWWDNTSKSTCAASYSPPRTLPTCEILHQAQNTTGDIAYLVIGDSSVCFLGSWILKSMHTEMKSNMVCPSTQVELYPILKISENFKWIFNAAVGNYCTIIPSRHFDWQPWINCYPGWQLLLLLVYSHILSISRWQIR